MTRINELGGTYDADDQFLDFWESLRTMKEKEFSRYVRQEKDNFRKLPRNRRGRIDQYIRDMSNKEVAMKADNEWNVLSQEDAMIMALVNTLEKKVTKSPHKNKSKSKKEKNEDNSSNESKANDNKESKKRFKVPEWKLQPPKDGEPREKLVEGKTYYWCLHCNKNEGMWVLHKPEDHKSDWKNAKQSSSQQGKKTVSFNVDTQDNDDDNSQSSDGPSVEVHESLLKNAKSYLAQFQNFPTGGTQG